MAERAEFVDQAAADWVARRDSEGWSRADQAEFDRWLGAATEHRVAWLRMDAAWRKGDLAGEPLPAAAPPVARRRTAAAALIAASLLAGALFAGQVAPKAYATGVGGARSEILDDGSRLQLNTDTKVLVPRSGEARSVRLERGEAFFAVRADAGRPFVVDAGDYQIVSGWAAFAVRRDRDQVAVTVEQGQVAVRRRDLPAGAAAPVICSAGQVLQALPEATRIVSRSPAKVQEALGWRRGLVIFDDSRLADVAAEFNRYNRTRLVITDPALAEARVGGAFRSGNLDAFVRILAQDLGVKARRENGRILLTAAEPS